MEWKKAEERAMEKGKNESFRDFSCSGESLVEMRKKRMRLGMRGEWISTAKERISRMRPCVAGKRSSIYRGVTRHRWTGRFEAHLWDKSTWNQNQNKKGKQVYLGAYDDEEAAARAYDLASLKYWGAGALINFPITDYARDLEEMQMVSKEEYLASLRRKSNAFSKRFSKCMDVPRLLQNSQFEAHTSQSLGDESRGVYSDSAFMGAKIDLNQLIPWWGPRRTFQSEQTERCDSDDELEKELEALESSMMCSEPYKLPSLGWPNMRTSQESSLVSASEVLSQSSGFKRLKKFLEYQDSDESQPVRSGFHGCSPVGQMPDLVFSADVPQSDDLHVSEMVLAEEGNCGRD